MNKTINNKGFTLIELLATIVILGIISTVTVVSVVNFFQKSKEKSEDVFIGQIKNYMSDYSSLYGSKLNYTGDKEYKKCYENFDDEVCSNVILKFSKDKGIEDVENAIVDEDLVNPSTKIKCDNSNTGLTIYRDSDYVYCFALEPVGDNSCISDTISSCENIYKPKSELIIDKCTMATDEDDNETGYCTFK